jgi:hypothetical protein
MEEIDSTSQMPGRPVFCQLFDPQNIYFLNIYLVFMVYYIFMTVFIHSHRLQGYTVNVPTLDTEARDSYVKKAMD